MTAIAPNASVEFELPDELVAHEPIEARGLERDEVRLMVTDVGSEKTHHASFTQLADFMERGDLLVVNDSATINASLPAIRTSHHAEIRLHLSTQLEAGLWAVELRQITTKGSAPLLDASPGERLLLPAGVEAELIEPWPRGAKRSPDIPTRLWAAALDMPNGFVEYTALYGQPIRYSYVPSAWPLSYYQTIFAREPGSAEMPSAGRPFTARVLAALARRGVGMATITLHTGVSSFESPEPPYPERYRVSDDTAGAVNAARRNNMKVVAVGTTVVRALETVVTEEGLARASEGWTRRVITRDEPPRLVDGLITGLHAPRASHLAMLEAFAGREQLGHAYDAALGAGYRWHEFGDMHFTAPRTL